MRRRAYGIYMRLEILKNLKSGLWHQLSRYQLTSGVFTCFNLKLLGHRIESKPISLQLQQHLIVQMWRLFQRLLRRTKRIYIYILYVQHSHFILVISPFCSSFKWTIKSNGIPFSSIQWSFMFNVCLLRAESLIFTQRDINGQASNALDFANLHTQNHFLCWFKYMSKAKKNKIKHTQNCISRCESSAHFKVMNRLVSKMCARKAKEKKKKKPLA